MRILIFQHYFLLMFRSILDSLCDHARTLRNSSFLYGAVSRTIRRTGPSDRMACGASFQR